MTDGYLAAASRCHDAVIQRLLAQGIEVNAKDQGGQTAPVAAAMGGCAATITMLASRGADVTAANAGGVTPLLAAAFAGSPETSTVPIEDARGHENRAALVFVACVDRRL